jgi:hypothetical protein
MSTRAIKKWLKEQFGLNAVVVPLAVEEPEEVPAVVTLPVRKKKKLAKVKLKKKPKVMPRLRKKKGR